MNFTTEKVTLNGYEATIIRPEKPNGKWIWKTEFLYAFDQAECDLLEMGYTRVYYQIKNMYGSPNAVKLMYDFYKFVTREYSLYEKCALFGFSRGGLYAFNFAMKHPECVSCVYLDAPVMDMRSWPPADSKERRELYAEYGLDENSIENYTGHPVKNFKEYFALKIPTILVAGDSDEIVPLPENSGLMIDYANAAGIPLTYYIKPGCKHHPHSLEDTKPIIDFINTYY